MEGIADYCTAGDINNEVHPGFAVTVPATTLAAGFGLEERLRMEIIKCGKALGRPEMDAPAPPAVSAVRAAPGHVLFPTERYASVPAVPPADNYSRPVNKEH